MRNLRALGLLSAILLFSCGEGSDGSSSSGTGTGTGTGSGSSGVGGASGGATGGSVGGTTGGSAGGATGGSAGGASGAGGASASGGTGGSSAPGDPFAEPVDVSTVTVPAGVKEGLGNYRIWGSDSLNVAPVYTVPLANCGTLVCFTSGDDNNPNAHVAYLDATDALVTTYDLGAYECRGLAAEADGHFAALLWSDATDQIWVNRYDIAGVAGWSEELTNADNHPDAFDIGEARLEYGGGQYGAYYHVHSDSGHEGDTLKWVAADTGTEDTEWDWGCSHSMSDLLRFHPTTQQFLPACVTDCYPGTEGSNFATDSIGGVYLNHDESKVVDVDAGCNGSVAGELGSLSPAANGWALVFNAHQSPATLGENSYDPDSMNQDIGFSAIGANLTPGSVVWLTTTPANEADASIARFEKVGGAVEQYLVGWLEPGAADKYLLTLVSAAGEQLTAPSDVAATARWGRRDNPFRQSVDKDIVWAWFDAPGSTTLNFARIDSGQTPECASF